MRPPVRDGDSLARASGLHGPPASKPAAQAREIGVPTNCRHEGHFKRFRAGGPGQHQRAETRQAGAARMAEPGVKTDSLACASGLHGSGAA
jgi:hypothetical protein